MVPKRRYSKPAMMNSPAAAKPRFRLSRRPPLNPEAVSENSPATSAPVWLITANASRRRKSVRMKASSAPYTIPARPSATMAVSHCRAAAGSSGKTKRNSA